MGIPAKAIKTPAAVTRTTMIMAARWMANHDGTTRRPYRDSSDPAGDRITLHTQTEREGEKRHACQYGTYSDWRRDRVRERKSKAACFRFESHTLSHKHTYINTQYYTYVRTHTLSLARARTLLFTLATDGGSKYEVQTMLEACRLRGPSRCVRRCRCRSARAGRMAASLEEN
jgi:hypothetical protein